jgi:nicotinamidase-related amidase
MSDVDPADNVVLVLVDWQERLFQAMPEGVREQNLNNAETLAWICRELGIPVIVSEQYPKGLGSTLPGLQAEDAVSKTSFSAMQEPAFAAALGKLGSRHVLLSGMETHICVAQTCRDLREANHPVWLMADACLSRRKLDWKLALQRMVVDGAQITTTETLIFDLLGGSTHPLFKELSRRIK